MVLIVLYVIALLPHFSLGYAFGNDLTYEGEEYVLALVNLTWVNKQTQTIHSEKDEMARFGNGLVSSVRGVVVHVNTGNGSLHDGCDRSFENEIPNESWIALISLGGCELDKKIKNAYLMNASAVAIYNNKKDGLLKMRLQSEYRLKIVAITLSKAKGELLAGWVDNGTRVVMAIEVGTQFSYKPYNINSLSGLRGIWKFSMRCRSYQGVNCTIATSVLFVSISFIVLMVISLAWLVLYYVQRFRYIHAKDQLSKQLCSAAKKALSKIPERTLRGSNKEFERENECCAVCIEPYRNHDVVRSLPCNHEFHKICIDPWLLTHRTCPMCKMDILKHYGLKFTGSQESILQIDEIFISDENDSDYYVSSAWIQTAAQELQQYVQGPDSTEGEEQRVGCVNPVVNDDPGVADTPVHTPSHVAVTITSSCDSQGSVHIVPGSPVSHGAGRPIIYCDTPTMSPKDSPQHSPRGSVSNSPDNRHDDSPVHSPNEGHGEDSEPHYSPKCSPTYSPKQSPRYSPTQSPLYSPVTNQHETIGPSQPNSCFKSGPQEGSSVTDASPEGDDDAKSETSNHWDLIYVKSSRL